VVRLRPARRPVLVALDAGPLLQLGHHDDRRAALLPYLSFFFSKIEKQIETTLNMQKSNGHIALLTWETKFSQFLNSFTTLTSTIWQ
jgi:hypothetical protein